MPRMLSNMRTLQVLIRDDLERLRRAQLENHERMLTEEEAKRVKLYAEVDKLAMSGKPRGSAAEDEEEEAPRSLEELQRELYGKKHGEQQPTPPPEDDEEAA